MKCVFCSIKKSSVLSSLDPLFFPTVPSGYPHSFSVISASSRSALFSWSPLHLSDRNGIITEYTINISVVETGEEFQLYLNSSITYVTVTTLRPYTTYLCSIAASTSVGIGPFSTILTFLTPEDGISITITLKSLLSNNISSFYLVPTSPPQEPHGHAVSSNTIILSWDPPPILERNGIIREYHINLTEEATEIVLTYISLGNSIEVSLLHPFYSYSWIVSAVTIDEGPYTEPSWVTTLEDGKFSETPFVL